MKSEKFMYMRSKVFFRLLRVNLTLCLVSLSLLSVIVLPFLMKTANENDQRINDAKLQACRAYLDAERTYVTNMVSVIQKQSWVPSVSVSLSKGSSVTYSTSEEIRDDLRYFKVNHSTISNISLYYYQNTDTIFNGYNIVRNRSAMQSLFPDDAQYAIFPLNGEEPGFGSVIYGNTKYLVYRTTFQKEYGAKPKGEICVFFSSTELRKNLLELLGDTATSVEICSNNGDVLHKIVLAETEVADSVSSIDSDPYIYQVTMPRYSSRSHVLRLIIYAIVFDVLACFVLSAVLTSFNYRPFGNILRQFAGEIPLAEDEFVYLSHSIQEIQDTCAEQEQVLEKFQPIVQTSIIHQLLNGSYNSDENQAEILAAYGIHFPFAEFAVIGISQKHLVEKDSLYDLLALLVKQLDHHPHLVAYFCSSSNNGFYILVNYRDDRAIENLLGLLQLHFRDAGVDNYHIAVSAPQQSTGHIYLACEQADTALSTAMLTHKKLVHFSDLYSPCDSGYYYPLTEEILFSRAIMEGQHEKACEILHSVIERNSDCADQGRNMPLLFYTLYSTISRSISGLNIQISSLDQFPNFPSNYAQLYQQLKDILVQVDEQLRDMKKATECSYVETILTYIDSNLFSSNLSLVSIADHFDKSPAYISAMFKRERGTNYSNYINQKRIEQAVKLLNSGNKDLQSICDAVGYTNPSTFTRNFQKYTGHSPFR